MRSVRGLLAAGNGKLGASIHHFDLPAVATCPGRTPVCERVCYAKVGRFRYPVVEERLAWCFRQSRRADFPDRMAAEIHRKGVLSVRLHVSGDFYDAGYAAKWLAVVRLRPKPRYFFYTRSWRTAAIAGALEDLAAHPSVRAWYSADRDSGLPDRVPAGVKVAYLQAEAGETGGDLLFRVRRLRRLKHRVGLPMVCPNETPRGRALGVNCGNCQHCWR